MSRLLLRLQTAGRGGYVVRITIANAFLLFPLIVMAAETIWGHTYASPPLKYFVYILTFTVLPGFGLAGYWLFQRSKLRERVTSLLELALTAPGLIAALLYLSPDGSWVPWNRIELFALLGCLTVLAGSALAFSIPLPWRDSWERACRPAATAAQLASPLVFIVVALWGERDWLAAHAAGDTKFQLGLLVGVVGVASIYAGPRMLASRFAVARIAGALWLFACGVGAGAALFRIGLDDVGFSCDPTNGSWTQTYGYWIGPANAVLIGATPMVDAFSIYGMLSYLAYAAAFKLVFPPSYFAADAVTALMNALAPAVAIAVCLKAARNRFLVLVVVAGVALALPWIAYTIPANGGPRIVAPMLLLLALAWLRPGRTHSWATLVSMVLCAFYSAEALIWTVITYTAFLGAAYLERRRDLSRCFGSFALTLSCIGIAYFVFAVIIHVVSGSWPRVDVYLGFMFILAEHGYAVVEPELANPIWTLPAGICLAALVYALSIILWRDRMERKRRWIVVSVIFPGAVLSAAELAYWVSRSYYGLLWQQVLPSIVSLVLLLDAMLSRGRRRPSAPPFHDVSAHATLAAALMILTGYAGSFDFGGLGLGFFDAFQRYRSAFTGQPATPCIGERAAEAVALIEKYEPNRRSALFFLPGSDDVSVAMYSGHRQRLGYTNPWMDLASLPLIRDADRRLDELVKPGDVLITVAYVYRQKGVVLDPYKFNNNLLAGAGFVEKLGSRFSLCEVERTSLDVVVVRVMPKIPGACASMGKPFQYEVREVQF